MVKPPVHQSARNDRPDPREQRHQPTSPPPIAGSVHEEAGMIMVPDLAQRRDNGGKPESKGRSSECRENSTDLAGVNRFVVEARRCDRHTVSPQHFHENLGHGSGIRNPEGKDHLQSLVESGPGMHHRNSLMRTVRSPHPWRSGTGSKPSHAPGSDVTPDTVPWRR